MSLSNHGSGRAVRLAGLWLTAAMLLAGCAAPGSVPRGASPSNGGDEPAARGSSQPKRAVVGIPAIHTTLQSRTVGPGRPRGYESLEPLVSAGLANLDDHGRFRPQLAEAVPTTENGLWLVFPDGRMETTWKIRENAVWHDGVAFTTDDLLFTAKVQQDKDLPNFRDAPYDFIDAVEAVDQRTVLLKWKRGFVRADEMFTDRRLVPLPKHRLEGAYVDNKPNFLDLAFWNQEFVGSGPFKVREWVLGSHLVLDAHERYVLGRPQLDELVVKFIQDPNTLIANVLTGEVDLTIGGVLSLEQAVQVRDRWTDGKVDIAFESWITIYPQFMGPNPAIIGDVQFRRALLYAIDRQEMADAIQYGLVPVAHGFLNPNAPEYQETERGVVRYEYDARRAGQLIEALGHVRGADGGFRDTGGQRLVVEIRALDPYEKPLLSVSDYWQRVGVGVEPLIIPRARSTDQEWRSLRPGFELLRQPNALGDLDRYHSSQVPTRENNFTGTSKHRYANPELDSLLDALFTTIPRQQRLQLAEAVLHHISDRVVLLPLYYDSIVALVGRRVQNMGVRKSEGSTASWNAEAWDLR